MLTAMAANPAFTPAWHPAAIDSLQWPSCMRQRAYSLPFAADHVSLGWRRGVAVSGVRRMNEVNSRRARLVLGWVTVFGRVYHLGM